jgi:hypothetical protein
LNCWNNVTFELHSLNPAYIITMNSFRHYRARNMKHFEQGNETYLCRVGKETVDTNLRHGKPEMRTEQSPLQKVSKHCDLASLFQGWISPTGQICAVV